MAAERRKQGLKAEPQIFTDLHRYAYLCFICSNLWYAVWAATQ